MVQLVHSSSRSICRLISGLLVLMLLCGCDFDFERPLPNGYSIKSTETRDVNIWSPDGMYPSPESGSYNSNMVTASEVTQVGIVGDIIIGRVVFSPHAHYSSKSEEGYFIINTRDHTIRRKLSLNKLRDATNSLGINLDSVTLLSPRSLPQIP